MTYQQDAGRYRCYWCLLVFGCVVAFIGILELLAAAITYWIYNDDDFEMYLTIGASSLLAGLVCVIASRRFSEFSDATSQGQLSPRVYPRGSDSDMSESAYNTEPTSYGAITAPPYREQASPPPIGDPVNEQGQQSPPPRYTPPPSYEAVISASEEDTRSLEPEIPYTAENTPPPVYDTGVYHPPPKYEAIEETDPTLSENEQ